MVGRDRELAELRQAWRPGGQPIAARNATETGTDVVGYLTEHFGFSAVVLNDGTVYQTYSAGSRGVEFLMGCYAILDRAPKGRDEGEGFQLWIRRHDDCKPRLSPDSARSGGCYAPYGRTEPGGSQ